LVVERNIRDLFAVLIRHALYELLLYRINPFSTIFFVL